MIRIFDNYHAPNLGASGGTDALVTGEIVWVYTDQKTHRPVPIPQSIRDFIATRERHLA